ncbi:MAG: hypothetical protein KBS75_06760 [Bacteroidales bacterium]|nr:hypothetical protein [Candidatus Equimonas faecalis]
MNLSSYLFGVYADSYEQYPDDYTSKILKRFSDLSHPPAQLIIHREGDLMYYGYTRMLGEEHHVGLCAVLNGVAITDVQRLFGAFERVVETMASRQSFICVKKKGELCSKLCQLRADRAEVTHTMELLKSCLENMDDATVNLPAMDTETVKDDVHRFCAEDDEAEILKYSLAPGYTVVWKQDKVVRKRNKIVQKLDKAKSLLMEPFRKQDKVVQKQDVPEAAPMEFFQKQDKVVQKQDAPEAALMEFFRKQDKVVQKPDAFEAALMEFLRKQDKVVQKQDAPEAALMELLRKQDKVVQKQDAPKAALMESFLKQDKAVQKPDAFEAALREFFQSLL